MNKDLVPVIANYVIELYYDETLFQENDVNIPQTVC